MVKTQFKIEATPVCRRIESRVPQDMPLGHLLPHVHLNIIQMGIDGIVFTAMHQNDDLAKPPENIVVHHLSGGHGADFVFLPQGQSQAADRGVGAGSIAAHDFSFGRPRQLAPELSDVRPLADGLKADIEIRCGFRDARQCVLSVNPFLSHMLKLAVKAEHIGQEGILEIVCGGDFRFQLKGEAILFREIAFQRLLFFLQLPALPGKRAQNDAHPLVALLGFMPGGVLARAHGVLMELERPQKQNEPGCLILKLSALPVQRFKLGAVCALRRFEPEELALLFSKFFGKPGDASFQCGKIGVQRPLLFGKGVEQPAALEGFFLLQGNRPLEFIFSCAGGKGCGGKKEEDTQGKASGNCPETDAGGSLRSGARPFCTSLWPRAREGHEIRCTA